MGSRYGPVAALLAALVSAQPLCAQSLGDVARTEEARRKNVKKSSKVYTNEDLKGAGEAPPAPPPAAAASTAKPEAKPETEKPKEESGPPKDEKYWRGRMTAMRDQVSRNAVLAEALQSRVNALNTEFANMDDPIRRAGIEQNRRKTLGEMERMKLETEKLNNDIVALEEEARRANVPPGWLR
jgi:hypothetical protein